MSVRDDNLQTTSFIDADISYRAKLGEEHPRIVTPPVGPLPTTFERNSSIKGLKQRQEDRAYYGRKWGGLPGYEVFTRPFNNKENPVGHHIPVVRPERGATPFSICLYGNFRSNGSFGRVSRGLKEGLSDMGLLAGCVEVDAADPSELEEGVGADAPIGIYAGAPSLIGVMTSYGNHRLNFAILAPNSSWLPDKLVRDMMQRACVVAPSSWGARVLATYTDELLAPLTHGVSKEFHVVPELHAELDRQYADGAFRVLHLTSTMRQRKATRELVLAWKGLVEAGRLGANPELHVIADAPDGTFEAGPHVVFHGPSNLPVEKMREIYQRCHVVVQPSRAEGFGMVPLEARACGIPVVATTCTGHADHKGSLDNGYVFVVHGDPVPIDDGPGALAPAVTLEAIAASLWLAHDHWKELHAAAQRYASILSHGWSWSHRIALWVNAMGVREL